MYKRQPLGWLAALIPVIIAPYYCVIGGWVVKYFVEFVRGNGMAVSSDTYFGDFISMAGSGILENPLLWFVIFVLLTAVVVLLGVDTGVEKASSVMMPVLVLLSVGISVYCMTLPGAAEGLKYYLLPDFADFSLTTVLAAMGQLFYSCLLYTSKSFLLGAAAQFGIYAAYFLAIFMGFNDKAAAAISIIGGADGPTSIFLAGKLGQTEFMGPIAVAAYSYMALVPIIQPPIMKLLTTEEERKIKMEQLRPVSKLEKILFLSLIHI